MRYRGKSQRNVKISQFKPNFDSFWPGKPRLGPDPRMVIFFSIGSYGLAYFPPILVTKKSPFEKMEFFKEHCKI